MRRKTDLRAAQVRTVTRLYEHDETQAILPMGGGKTAAALTAFDEMKRDGVAKEMFVLAPKRVAMLVWPAEPLEWEHLRYLKVVVVHGAEHKRLQLLREPADIYCIGVDLTQWFVEWLKQQPIGRLNNAVLCIDELSRFKNPRGKRAKALFPLVKHFVARWGLTGTPRPNGYEDQFMPLKLLTDGRLWGRSFDRWQRENMYPLDFNQYKWAVLPERLPAIMEGINKVSITIGPEDMPDVPELNDGPEFISWVDMPYDVEQTYKEMEKHLIAEVRKGTITAANMAVASGKLAQIAQGFLYINASKDEYERLHDVKMERLHELIEEAGGEQVIIAYDFRPDLWRLQEEFPGLPYMGKSDEDDRLFERAWNDGSMPIGALHPASAGHGLNLQHGGRQVFWYGFGWSGELYDQLLKRFHRPGQKLPVFSRPILMRGTVDEIKYSRVRDKITAQEAFRRLIKEV